MVCVLFSGLRCLVTWAYSWARTRRYSPSVAPFLYVHIHPRPSRQLVVPPRASDSQLDTQHFAKSNPHLLTSCIMLWGCANETNISFYLHIIIKECDRLKREFTLIGKPLSTLSYTQPLLFLLGCSKFTASLFFIYLSFFVV